MMYNYNVVVGNSTWVIHTTMSEAELERCWRRGVDHIAFDFCHYMCDVPGDERMGAMIGRVLVAGGITHAAGVQINTDEPTIVTKAMFLDIWIQTIQIGARWYGIPETIIVDTPAPTFYIGGAGAVDGVLY